MSVDLALTATFEYDPKGLICDVCGKPIHECPHEKGTTLADGTVVTATYTDEANIRLLSVNYGEPER